ncbi:Fe-S cluster assembly protein SufD [Xylocopilactobacillus apis]|uniref:Fe-S cluster assembly protein SufD n=1 Tax=Xylocopilactobacillus apis TaxID=2932183 RepID=A0AAU9D5X0_9LACO|nr:Fe-S cluster assembly protein SufD [Xylocopilactobacillus apis]BDR56192.1 Fe-S cluster assembly protein SufD [Xylocopilactobacillus apis]
MENDRLIPKEILTLQSELNSEGPKDLQLPSFDQINVKSLQLIRPDETFNQMDSEDTFELSDNFAFSFKGGELNTIKVPQEYLDQGLIITDMTHAFSEYANIFSSYFSKLISAREDLITFEHYRRLSGGVFIYVPDEMKIKETLQAYFHYSTHASQSIQVVLIVGKNAKLSITENQMAEMVAEGDYSNFFEIYPQEGSVLSYVVNDQSKTTGHNYFYRYFETSERATVNLTSGEFTEGNVLINNKIRLKGNDSTGEVKTVAIAQNDQLSAINSRVTNVGLRTKGNILQHGVILDRAKLVFNGIGQILKGARGSDSQQENRVLMLSEKARGDANPILLIDENDVTAGHAASVGRIDEEQLYYLESRGLDADMAKRLIIKGFLESVITVVESQRTQKMLRSVIERSLNIDNQ